MPVITPQIKGKYCSFCNSPKIISGNMYWQYGGNIEVRICKMCAESADRELHKRYEDIRRFEETQSLCDMNAGERYTHKETGEQWTRMQDDENHFEDMFLNINTGEWTHASWLIANKKKGEK